MKTAVDTSVLLDVLGADTRFGERSRAALRSAYDAGALVACEIVWAEVRAHFATDAEFREALDLLGVRFEAIGSEAAATAGRLWRENRRASTRPRQDRVVADFLIGAHATHQAEALLSRDRGFYRCGLAVRVIDPSAR